jgi:hypothetical protein
VGCIRQAGAHHARVSRCVLGGVMSLCQNRRAGRCCVRLRGSAYAAVVALSERFDFKARVLDAELKSAKEQSDEPDQFYGRCANGQTGKRANGQTGKKQATRELILDEMELVVLWKALLRSSSLTIRWQAEAGGLYQSQATLRVHLMRNWFPPSDPPRKRPLMGSPRCARSPNSVRRRSRRDSSPELPGSAGGQRSGRERL